MIVKPEWQVYIIRATSGKLYTGITNHLENRLRKHNNKKGARFFYFQAPKQLSLPNLILIDLKHLNVRSK